MYTHIFTSIASIIIVIIVVTVIVNIIVNIAAAGAVDRELLYIELGDLFPPHQQQQQQQRTTAINNNNNNQQWHVCVSPCPSFAVSNSADLLRRWWLVYCDYWYYCGYD